jgi:hypothetical protein
MNDMIPHISLKGVVSEDAELIARRRRQRSRSNITSLSKEEESQLTYYSVSMCHVVRSALWKLGGDLKKVSELLDIPLETLNSWKSKFKEFKTACIEGKERSTQEIENALRGCAVPHDEVSEEDGPDGTKTTTKRNVVDTRAAIAVLKAKGDSDWRGTKRSGGGITGNTIQVNFNSFGGALPKQQTITVETQPSQPVEESDGSD